MDLCNPKEIKALLGRHGFRFSKQMGQNFLIQPWVPRHCFPFWPRRWRTMTTWRSCQGTF